MEPPPLINECVRTQSLARIYWTPSKSASARRAGEKEERVCVCADSLVPAFGSARLIIINFKAVELLARAARGTGTEATSFAPLLVLPRFWPNGWCELAFESVSHRARECQEHGHARRRNSFSSFSLSTVYWLGKSN